MVLPHQLNNSPSAAIGDDFGWGNYFKSAWADLHFHLVLDTKELPVVLDRKVSTSENDLFRFKVFLSFLECAEIDAREVQPVPPSADLEESDIDETIVDLSLGSDLPVVTEVAGFSENTIEHL